MRLYQGEEEEEEERGGGGEEEEEELHRHYYYYCKRNVPAKLSSPTPGFKDRIVDSSAFSAD